MTDLQHVAADLDYDVRAATWLAQHAPTLADRLPLGTLVVLVNGAQGVVTGYSTLSSQRYEIAWFDRRFWRVNRRCFDRAQFVVYDGAAENAAVETAALSA